jgi:hypothetical protein
LKQSVVEPRHSLNKHKQSKAKQSKAKQSKAKSNILLEAVSILDGKSHFVINRNRITSLPHSLLVRFFFIPNPRNGKLIVQLGKKVQIDQF